MSDDTPTELRDRIDGIADDFENKLRQGESPNIASYLRDFPESHRGALLLELVCIEAEYKLRRGQSVDVSEYLRAFPQLNDHEAELRRHLDRCRQAKPADDATRLEISAVERNQTRKEASETPAAGDISPPTPQAGISSARRFDIPQIDGYEVLESIGSGGMGGVWKAIQLSTRRLVALKLMHPSLVGSPSARLRFEREVELSAKLDHPYIASTYESGVNRGLYYLTMELIDGVTLTKFAAEQKLGVKERVELLIAVCQAVQHAHQRGVIHRDLKPSNILVTASGEPKVLDFGLAKLMLDQDSRLTQTGDVGGTPAYMAPEQARGDSDRIDTRSDVYSLGAILYELLTGKIPRDLSGSYLDILHRAANSEVSTPRGIRPDIANDLEAIVMKALSNSQAERYGTAGELGADLQRYISDEAVLARPQTTMYVMRKRLRRHSRLVSVICLIVIASIVATGFYIVRMQNEQHRTALALLDAKEQQQQANASSENALEQRAQTLKLVNDVLSRVEKRLALVDTDPTTREELLQVSRQALAQMSDAPEFEQDRAFARANAQLQLANVLASTGHFDDAEINYRSAVDYFETSMAAHPNDLSHQHAVVANTLLGRFYLSRKQPENAETFLLRAQKILESSPGGNSMADSWNLLIATGDVKILEKDLAAARDFYTKAENLFANAPNDPEIRSMRIISLERLADVLSEQAAGDGQSELLESAVNRLHEAIDLDQSGNSRPEVSWRVEQARLHLKVATLFECLHRNPDAAAAAHSAGEYFQTALRLSAAGPDDRRDFALALIVEAETTDENRSSDCRRRAAEVLRGMLAEDPAPDRADRLKELLARADGQALPTSGKASSSTLP